MHNAIHVPILPRATCCRGAARCAGCGQAYYPVMIDGVSRSGDYLAAMRLPECGRCRAERHMREDIAGGRRHALEADDATV